VFAISIDLELAWGIRHKRIRPSTWRAVDLEREVISDVLGLFSRYNTKATWAIVGHLLLGDCRCKGERVYPATTNADPHDESRDSFSSEPVTDRDPRWHGRDIVDLIRAARPEQDVASHSFLHIRYGEETTAADVVRTDILNARLAHENLGLPFEVFVFPWNVIGFKHILADAGIRAYRSREKDRCGAALPVPLRRLFNLYRLAATITPATARPSTDGNGMVGIPQSMLLTDRAGIRGLIPTRNVIKMGIAGLDRAARQSEVFHLWFHPSDLVHRRSEQLHVLEGILEHASHLAAIGMVQSMTLAEICRQATADLRGRDCEARGL
jgi:peptidoglycan/xylan/chitin deacetylase (PgdA/CDA1 family)